MNNKTLLKTVNLKKYFPVRRFLLSKDYVKAVDGVSIEIAEGETLGLVGESGCGKTTLGRTVLRLIEPTEGDIIFNKKSVLELEGEELKRFRREAQIVFQDPYSSLDPRMTVFEIVMEGVRAHNIEVEDPEEFVVKQLETVGLKQEHLYRYPHEFSGGQKQRIAIARTLALRPKFVVLDEPTSALDVSVQAQILNMLKDLQKQFGLTYLFISHDLGVVKYMSNRIAVMYIGKVVEIAESNELFENPLHPYTKMLFAALPIPDPKLTRERKRMKVIGEPPSPINVPPGCRFWPRCPYATTKCRVIEPPLFEVSKGHYVACWLYE